MHTSSKLPLAAWLRSLDQPAAGPSEELLLGGSGHLLLTQDEERNVTAQLRTSVLPRLFEGAQARTICILTGLAPGADLLFANVVGQWLHDAGIAHRTVGLLPLPVDLLLDDWVRVAEAGRTLEAADIGRQRERMMRTLRGCNTIVDLLPPASASQLPSVDFRQSQYRRLAACLAQRSDILVAILRPENPNRPGGTAEVVDWRRNPGKIPDEFSTWPVAAADPAYKRRLFLIDPESLGQRVEVELSEAATPRNYEVRATNALHAGNYVHCYDLSQQARALGFDSPRLRYLSLLALANAGSTGLAWRRYNELGLRGDERDEDWLALKGRLLKDLALGNAQAPFAGAAAPADLLPEHRYIRAAQAYLGAHRLAGGYFSAINAATMFQLAGDGDRARQLAHEVLASLAEPGGEDRQEHPEREKYYRLVSEAEASLLIGDLPRYRDSLGRADRLMRGNFNARSRTRAQLRMLCRALDLDEALPALLSLPEVIRIRRRAQASRRRIVRDAELPAACQGALVFVVVESPADLQAAEIMQARGAHLHLVLPNERANMFAQWSLDYGLAAAERLSTLLEQAGDLTVARGFLDSESLWSHDYVAALADGLAALDARRLGCQVRELLIDEAQGEGGPDPHLAEAVPAALPLPASRHGERRFAGLIFADIVGFRRLHDEHLPRFWEVVMGAIARIVERHDAQVLFRGTWGDALHLVTEDAATAAGIAIEIQALFETLRATETGGLADIELRLAVHFGPVYSGFDPIVGAPMFYGSQLAFTARIEPITPPGMIFVTELFAARLMLDAPARFALEYVGELALAKLYGRYRLFSLRTAPQ